MDCRTSLLLAFCLSLSAIGCVSPNQTTRMAAPAPITPPPVPAASLTASNTAQAKPTDTDKIKSKIRILMYEANYRANLAKVQKNELEQANLRDKAREAYQDVLKLDPKHLPAYQGLAQMYLRTNQKERAVETIKQALAISPRDPNLFYDLATCHCCRREWKEAENALYTALQIEPDNREYKKQLGLILAREGQFDRSIEMLAQVYAGPAYAHYLVARMLDGTFGQEEACKQHLRRALEINPNLQEARDLLSGMEAPAVPRSVLAQPTEVQPQSASIMNFD